MGVHLLALSDLSIPDIVHLLDQAEAIRKKKFLPDMRGRIACNLFFESSTRTQYSFCVAQERLGMRVISFNPQASSMNKEETFYDTVKTFDSMGVDAIVIRHKENEYYNQLIGRINAPLLNGGDGTGNHPTQSLLDLMTIRQEFGTLQGLKVAIIGDTLHSRVAHGDAEAMRRLGMEVVMTGPPSMTEQGVNAPSIDEVIETSDVVMMLRLQFERHADKLPITREQYHQQYGLTKQRVGQMKPGAIIMHPAPVNRNVEIADDVVECAQSRIFKQMENGVFVRMAALCRSLGVQE